MCVKVQIINVRCTMISLWSSIIAVQLCCLNSYHTKYVLILLHAKVCEIISRTNEKSANPYG